ncbi:6-phosphogluconolactonase [Ponticoccus alexandrii]|nr:6-phosphogluconolactonase [Ponticoccus alexandrii]
MMTPDHVASSPAKAGSGLSERYTVEIYRTRTEMGRAVAMDVANRMRAVAADSGSVRMIFAAAPSQSEVLAALTALPNVPWDKVTAFHMDDYLGLEADAPQRFGNWLQEHLFSKIPAATVHRIAATGTADEICQGYAALLGEAPIDIVCLGIGVNGHIAFNDPPVADFDDPLSVRVVALDEVCRQQQVDDDCFDRLEDVPQQAITLTIPTLMGAGALFCTVPGARKKAAVKAALEGPITTECPASILRTHPNCTIYLDREAAPHG